jgi:hypothetical protein
MTKHELQVKTDRAVQVTKYALQTVYDALNPGQQKKILKDEAVKKLFDLYEVEHSK